MFRAHVSAVLITRNQVGPQQARVGLGRAAALAAQIGRRGHRAGPNLALLLGPLVVDAHTQYEVTSDHKGTTGAMTSEAMAAA